MLDELVRTKPALVVATGTRTDSLVDRGTGDPVASSAAGAEWKAGWRRTLAPLEKAGVTVAVLRDTPWPGKDMAVCVDRNRSEPSACDVSRKALDSPAYDVRTTSGSPTAHGVDLSDVICDADRCPATRGKYLVYRDTDHLTATFARALAPYLDEAARGRSCPDAPRGAAGSGADASRAAGSRRPRPRRPARPCPASGW